MTRKAKISTRSGGPAPYLPLFVLLMTFFLSTAVVTFSSVDWPNPNVYPHAHPVHNACGRAGAWVAYHAIRLLGAGVYALLFFAGMAALHWLTRGAVQHLAQRIVGALVITAANAAAVNVVGPSDLPGLPGGYSGALGEITGALLKENFSGFGTFLVIAYCVLAGLLFTIDGFWNALGELVRKATRALGGTLASIRSAAQTIASGAMQRRGNRTVAEASGATDRAGGVNLRNTQREASTERKAPAPEARKSVREADGSSAAEGRSRLPQLRFRGVQPDQEESTGCYPAVLDDWILPPISILEETQYDTTPARETQARERASVLERTLRDYKIEAPVVAIDTGPVITMYELQLAPGVKVSQITALSNDIARAMKAPAVRVVATMAGKSTVGVEVPRLNREKVRLKELMNLSGKRATEMALPLFLGKDAGGNPIVHDLARMPHVLIAGTTGSGKSVCINSIIMSVLMTQRPDRVKLILVDPKMVELNVFKDVPHLMCPIVTDMQKAERILEWACTKMDERYALLAEAGVRNIAGFNNLSKEEIAERFQPCDDQEAGQIPAFLPYVIIVIDELADLMMTSAKEVEFHLSRLAQKSRAVGIHIVVATQRPEAKVVTGLIKSNLPCRCAFRVAARMDSRIVLDQNGAEVLLGQGDMLFLPPGSSHLVRAQGTLIEDVEIHRAIKDLKGKGKCEFHPELMKIRSTSGNVAGERDELFEKATDIVIETQRGSVSLLQRRLTIGYSRASRLIDQMSDAGIVGQYKGSQAREVLVTSEDWEAMKAQAQEDLEEPEESRARQE